MSNRKSVVMCFSGLDPTGGAGIQADIETVFSLGCHGAPIITALTVQDSKNVLSLSASSAAYLQEQAQVVIADMKVDCFKLGLLPNREVIEVIQTILTENSKTPVVLDPILSAGGGFEFSGNSTIDSIIDLLLPLTTVATPNTEELARLAPGENNQKSAAQKLLDSGCRNILVTGTHADTDSVENNLYSENGDTQVYSWPRLGASYHGSGCTLASAIAAGLAKNLSAPDAISQAQQFTWDALNSGAQYGEAQHLPDRAHSREEIKH